MKHFSFSTLSFVYSTSSRGCSRLDSYYDKIFKEGSHGHCPEGPDSLEWKILRYSDWYNSLITRRMCGCSSWWSSWQDVELTKRKASRCVSRGHFQKRLTESGQPFPTSSSDLKSAKSVSPACLRRCLPASVSITAAADTVPCWHQKLAPSSLVMWTEEQIFSKILQASGASWDCWSVKPHNASSPDGRWPLLDYSVIIM